MNIKVESAMNNQIEMIHYLNERGRANPVVRFGKTTSEFQSLQDVFTRVLEHEK